MNDKGVRSLVNLENSASTARVLNLRFRPGRESAAAIRRPFFQNPGLNNSIVIKHRLRSNEIDVFELPRQTATKIAFPIDSNDLRLGARYIFIGQKNYREMLETTFGPFRDGCQDLTTLTLLDELPSLDPFILREQLKRHGIEPDLGYFHISEADMRRMSAFVEEELTSLLNLTGLGGAAPGQAGIFVHKLLSASSDAELEPLRVTLQLNPRQYYEGVFCWKAFLYYKWQLSELMPKAEAIRAELAAIRTVGPQDRETKIYITGTRERIGAAISSSFARVQATLDLYDTAYRSLTQGQDAKAFRDFLLRAPTLFKELGERLAGIEHFVSFWRFRFAKGIETGVQVDELIEILRDFIVGLNCSDDARESAAPGRRYG